MIRLASLAAAELPNLGRDSIIGTCAAIGSFLAGASWFLLKGDLEGVERAGVFGALAGAGFGLIAYLVALIEGVL